MNKRFVWITVGLSAALIGVSGAFFAGAAWAADTRLDSAVDFLVKGRALLNASENPGHNPPFGYHRQNAVIAINFALSEIDKAKTYADAGNPVK